MIRFNHQIAFEEKDRLPDVAALYAVYANETLLYIGAAFGLRRRFKSHQKQELFKSNRANRICWNEYDNTKEAAELLKEAERVAIFELGPPLNISEKGRPVKKCEASCKSVSVSPIRSWQSRQDSKLHQATFAHLWSKIEEGSSKSLTLQIIANETGLSYSWLDHFARDLGSSPSVARVETLYEYLTETELKV